MPVVLARAWIYWRDDDFVGAEREFRASAEFCSENSVWRLNAGHVLFMQGDKYKESAAFYEPIVRQHNDDVSAYLSRLRINCRSFIMLFHVDNVCTRGGFSQFMRLIHYDFSK